MSLTKIIKYYKFKLQCKCSTSLIHPETRITSAQNKQTNRQLMKKSSFITKIFAKQEKNKENIEKMKIPRRFIDHKMRRTSIVVYLLWSNKHTQNTQKKKKQKKTWDEVIILPSGVYVCVFLEWGIKFSQEEKTEGNFISTKHSTCHFISFSINYVHD